MENNRTMLDILKERLPEGLEIIKVKENYNKYILSFKFEDQIVNKIELQKTCGYGYHNYNCDFTIKTAMSSIYLNKGNILKAKEWLDKKITK